MRLFRLFSIVFLGCGFIVFVKTMAKKNLNENNEKVAYTAPRDISREKLQKTLNELDRKVKTSIKSSELSPDRPTNQHEVVISKFKLALDNANRFNAKKLQNEIFSELELKESMDEIVTNAFQGKETAHKKFGDDQAIVRVMAIEYLNFLVKKGNSEPLEKTLTKMACGRASQLMLSEKGLEQDFRDLVFIYLKKYDRKSAGENIKEIVSKIGFSCLSDQAKAIQKEEIFQYISLYYKEKSTDIIDSI
jgi:hypothetical protein